MPVGQDEVDRLIAAWRRERPDLDVRPLEVLSRLARLARHFDRVRRDVFSVHGLQIGDFEVLSALRRAGSPYQLSPSRLAEQVLVGSATMTHYVARLTIKDLVRRVPDPADHRGLLVVLSVAGLAQVDSALTDLLFNEQKLLAGFTDPQRDLLVGLLRILLGPLDSPARPHPTALHPDWAGRPSRSAVHPTATTETVGEHRQAIAPSKNR